MLGLGNIQTSTLHDNDMQKHNQHSPRHFSSQEVNKNNQGGVMHKIRSTFGMESKSKSQVQNDLYASQMAQMAQTPTLTLLHYLDQINEGLGSGGWKSYVPFLKSSDAMKEIQKTKEIVEATTSIMGQDVGIDELREMDKKEKLKICIKAGIELQDINLLVQQFSSLELLHRILRYRTENDLPIPSSEEDAKMVLQRDARFVMTEQEKKEVKRVQQKAMGRRR